MKIFTLALMLGAVTIMLMTLYDTKRFNKERERLQKAIDKAREEAAMRDREIQNQRIRLQLMNVKEGDLVVHRHGVLHRLGKVKSIDLVEGFAHIWFGSGETVTRVSVDSFFALQNSDCVLSEAFGREYGKVAVRKAGGMECNEGGDEDGELV